MRTTKTTSRAKRRPEAETDRERAWAHLLENPGGGRRMRSHEPYDMEPLMEIARSYDRTCQRARGLLDLTRPRRTSWLRSW